MTDNDEDLVDLLQMNADPASCDGAFMLQAADEIERLRGLLESVATCVEKDDYWGFTDLWPDLKRILHPLAQP